MNTNFNMEKKIRNIKIRTSINFIKIMSFNYKTYNKIDCSNIFCPIYIVNSITIKNKNNLPYGAESKTIYDNLSLYYDSCYIEVL